MIQLCRLIAVLSMLVALKAAAAQSANSRNLLVGVNVPDVAGMSQARVLRSRLVQVDVDALEEIEVENPAAQAGLMLNLFDDISIRPAVIGMQRRDAASATWTGHARENPAVTFTLVREGHTLTGNIRVPGKGVYAIRWFGGGLHSVRLIDESRLPACGCSGNMQPPPDLAPPPAQGGIAGQIPGPGPGVDDGSLIDVMVVYSNQALAAAGSAEAMAGVIETAIAETNIAYANSLINPRVRLVHHQAANYNESGDFSTDLGRLTGVSDGHMDHIHALRDEHRADLVALLIDNLDSCGMGWLMQDVSADFASQGFSAMNWECAATTYTFAHELGHNMGCHHDRENAIGQGAFPYSYGYRLQIGPQLFRTVMAYAPGERLQHFSNPDVSYQGQPTGVPVGETGEAHNALTINQTAFTVANFRPSVDGAGGGECEVTISGQPATQAVCPGQPATFIVIAQSDAPLDYQWQLNGLDIEGATGSTYAIGSVTRAHLGNYSVRVSDGCDTENSVTATLSILPGPPITQQPVGGDMCLGAPAQLTVTALGALQQDVVGTATFNAAQPSVMRGNHYSVSSPGTLLRIEQHLTLDRSIPLTFFVYEAASASAPYQLIATSVVDDPGTGTGFFVSGELNVGLQPGWRYILGCAWEGEPTYFYGGSHPQETLFGRTLGGFSGKFDGTLPEHPTTIGRSVYCQRLTVSSLSYQWRRNGQAISGAVDPTLVFPSMSGADFGSYDVVVSSSCGSSISQAAMISATGAVSITQQPQSQEACPGDEVTFITASSAAAQISTIGATSFNGNQPAVMRGTYYLAGRTSTLTRIEPYLQIIQPTPITYFVYESQEGGPYELIAQATREDPDVGTGFVESPPLGVRLIVGRTYLIGAGWNGSHRYYWGGSFPQQTAIGSAIGSFFGSFAGGLPSNPEAFGTQVHRQRLTTLPVAFQWRFEGTDLHEAHGPALTIPEIDAGDFGEYEAVVSNGCSTEVSAIAALSPGECESEAGDFNGDGLVDGNDLDFLVSQWGGCVGCAADLDGSGAVDGIDLGFLFSLWTPENSGNVAAMAPDPQSRPIAGAESSAESALVSSVLFLSVDQAEAPIVDWPGEFIPLNQLVVRLESGFEMPAGGVDLVKASPVNGRFANVAMPFRSGLALVYEAGLIRLVPREFPLDLPAILDHWGDCARCAADLNADGVVDALDLSQWLEDREKPQAVKIDSP